MTSLEDEFAGCVDRLDARHFAWFAKLGIPSRTVFGLRSLVGVGRIVPNASGLFELHDDGEPALIIAEGEPEVPGWAVLDDLVAVMPDDADRWWLRRGAIDLLGAYNLNSWTVDPVVLHATPMRWLQGGARGFCIIDWQLDPGQLLFGATGGLVADSEALRDRLRQRIVDHALSPWAVGMANVA